ncbi:MAG: hypothetical protein IJB27_06030 [Clostridia bacterium]|nr:hypothetical protein [Clostridia bacterium]
MEFLNNIDSLIENYKGSCIVRENGTLLLNPGVIPICEHMIFPAMSKSYYKRNLLDRYKLPFPNSYLMLLEHFNGANLYTVKLNTPKHSFASILFSIYGVPSTPPFSRAPQMEESFDVRVEDLSRHPMTPDTWLKCGAYTRNYEFGIRTDIFIDTQTERVYACPKNEFDVVESWDTLDNCFCEIFNFFKNHKSQYEFNPQSIQRTSGYG